MGQLLLSEMLAAAAIPANIVDYICNDAALVEASASYVLKLYYNAVCEFLRTGWFVVGVDGGLLDGEKLPLWWKYQQHEAVSVKRVELALVHYVSFDDYMVATINQRHIQLQIKAVHLGSTFAELLTGKYEFFTGNPFQVSAFSFLVDVYSDIKPKDLYARHPQCVLETDEVPEENGFYHYGRYGYCELNNVVFKHPNGHPLLVLKSTLDTLLPHLDGGYTYVAFGSKPYLRGILNGKAVGFRGSEAFVESEKWSLDDWAANL
jgi:hypothetical protein